MQSKRGDEELKQALRTKRILEVNGFLRPLSQAYLNNALELMLNTFVSLNAQRMRFRLWMSLKHFNPITTFLEMSCSK